MEIRWKLVLITLLRTGDKGFNEICRELGISPRVLSKELQELEINGLVGREVRPTRPISVSYGLTEYSHGLDQVLRAMEEGGRSTAAVYWLLNPRG